MSLLLFLAAVHAADAAPAVSVSTDLGFSGWVVPDVWLPLRVEVRSSIALSGVVDVEVPNGPAAGAAVYRRALLISPGSRLRFTIPVVIQDPRRPLILTVRDAHGEAVLRQDIVIGRDRVVEGVVIALSSDPAGLEFLAGYPRRLRGAYVGEAMLPDHWAAYAGVDLVVLRDADERSLSGVQRRALRQWVAQGGRLLVTGGILQQRQAWLADLLPAVVSPAPVMASAERLLPGMPAPLPVAVLRPKPGAEARPAGGLPLVVSRPYGRGLVMAWAFDAFAPSVRSWPGRLALWDQILTGRPARPVAQQDLIDVIPTARTLSGAAQVQIVALAVLYILAIRLVLRRAAGRAAVLVALATVVAVFTILLYAASSTARRSAAATVQLSVVESTGAGDLAAVKTYLAVLLPYGGSYRVTTPDGSLLRPMAPLAVLSTAANAVEGEAAPSVLLFEAVQTIAFPVHGQAVASGEGLELDVDNGSGLTMTAPSVYLNGQTQALPEIAAHLAVPLPPQQWERADRNTASGNFEHDARVRLAARLDAYMTPAIIGYKTLWLIGAIRDPRLSAHLDGAGEQQGLSLVLSPIDVTGGR
ncbi:MAG TPA: hypothetical protein VGK88_03835 [bacterium]